MDVLRCKTPALVRKENWGHLLFYNVLGAAMAQDALWQGLLPRQVSLQEGRQTLEAFCSPLCQTSPTQREGVARIVLQEAPFGSDFYFTAADRGVLLGNRPGDDALQRH